MPDTEAGKRLLLGLPSQGTGLVALNTEALTEAIAATEREAWLQGHDEAVRLQAEYDRDAVAAERERIKAATVNYLRTAEKAWYGVDERSIDARDAEAAILRIIEGETP